MVFFSEYAWCFIIPGLYSANYLDFFLEYLQKRIMFFSDLAIAHVPYKDSYDTTLDLSSHNIETFLGIGI